MKQRLTIEQLKASLKRQEAERKEWDLKNLTPEQLKRQELKEKIMITERKGETMESLKGAKR